MGYKDDIQIDINALDVELLRQAPLYQRWGKREAEALYKKDQIEEALSKCKAKTDLAVRANPQKFGFEGTGKPTEGAITSMVLLRPEVEQATELFLKSKYTARVLGIATKSFEHKKKALEKLTDLYINGYWATPKVGMEAQEAFDNQARGIANETMKGDKRMLALAKKREEERVVELEAKAEVKDKAEAKENAKAKTSAKARAKVGAKAKTNKTGDSSVPAPSEIPKPKTKAKVKATSQAQAKAAKFKPTTAVGKARIEAVGSKPAVITSRKRKPGTGKAATRATQSKKGLKEKK